MDQPGTPSNGSSPSKSPPRHLPGGDAPDPVRPPDTLHHPIPEAFGKGRHLKKHPHREEKSPNNKEDKDQKKDEDDKKEKEDEEKPKKWSAKKKWTVGIIVAIVLIVGLIVGTIWYLHARHFENTDDAYIDAHTERVAPRVAGRVLHVLVNDNQVVAPDQILVEIDPSDFNASLAAARAAIAQAQGGLAQSQAQKKVAEANVEQTQAEVDQSQVNLDNLRTELARYESLPPAAVSAQQVDNVRTQTRNAAAQLEATRKKLAASRAQVDLADSQIQAAQASIQSAQAQADQAELNLSYTHIRSATGGRVTQRQVQDGDYLTAGQQILIVVPQTVYVTANFKETQLTDMRPGQPVTIEVDAYPDHKFVGHVDSIQSSSGAVFSLLPPENATGNFVKVVQRVPVKITFDDTHSQDYRRLSPGMSVVPKVRVR